MYEYLALVTNFIIHLFAKRELQVYN